MLAQMVCGTLAACGRRVLYADVAATPTLGVLVRANLAAGGVQISASHNPPAYNGLKLFNADGRVFPRGGRASRCSTAYRESAAAGRRPTKSARSQQLDDTIGAASALILQRSMCERDSQPAISRSARQQCGAGEHPGSALAYRLGCEITLLGGQPTGQLEHPPEPTAENLAGVCQKVRRQASNRLLPGPRCRSTGNHR